jgi:hypothetical protein
MRAFSIIRAERAFPYSPFPAFSDICPSAPVVALPIRRTRYDEIDAAGWEIGEHLCGVAGDYLIVVHGDPFK